MKKYALSLAMIACAGLGFLAWKHNFITRTAPLVKQLALSADAREQKYARLYETQNIPSPVARIAGKIDRYEEDVATLQKRLHTADTLQETERWQLLKALEEAEGEALRTLTQEQETLDLYTQKAFRERDATLLKLIQILKSRAFLFERNF